MSGGIRYLLVLATVSILLIGTYPINLMGSAITDSLIHELQKSKDDESRTSILAKLCFKYRNTFPDSGLTYCNSCNQSFELEKGDGIYIFTDGLPDQQGMVDGNRIGFGWNRIIELLKSNNDLSMDKMHDKVDSTIREFQGEEKQLDDMLMVGIRI